MSYWWVAVVIVVILFLLRAAWKAYTHKSAVLGRQAANMNWRAAGSIKNKDGTRNVKYKRGDLLAVVPFDDPHVELVHPSGKAYARSNDFVELERWLTAQEAGEAKPEETNQPDVSRCLEALKKIERDIYGVIGPVPFENVKEQVKSLIIDETEKTSASIKEDKIAPRTLVCLLITNVLDQELSYGGHHIYRGVLSSRGEGLLTLWDWATDELENDGFFSEPDDAANEKKYIREAIKKVG